MLSAVAKSDPWETFSIDDSEVVALGRDAAAVVYAARAARAGEGDYVAAMTTVYRCVGEAWGLVVQSADAALNVTTAWRGTAGAVPPASRRG